MYKKIVSVLLVLVMSISMFSFASASDVMPRAESMGTHTESVSLTGTTLKGIANFTGVSSVTKITINMTFQKKGLLWWNDIETWTGTVANTTYNFIKSINVESGGKYRIKVVYTVYSGSSSETITATSSTVS